MRNEWETLDETETYLRNLGCSIVDKEGRNNRIDLIGYTVDLNGEKKIAAVVEIKKHTIAEAQHRLIASAKSLEAPYALLVIKDPQDNWNHYWFNVETSLPLMDEPRFESKGYLIDFIEVQHQLNKVIDVSLPLLYGTWETIHFLGDILLIRSYLYEINELERWSEIGEYHRYGPLRTEAYHHYKLEPTDDLWIIKVSDIDRNQIIKDLAVLNPQHSLVGTAFLNVVTHLIEKAGRRESQFVTTAHVRTVFRGLVSSLDIKGGKWIDLSLGIGTILADTVTEQVPDSAIGLEIDQNVARIPQIFFIISGLDKVSIKTGNSLFLGKEHQQLYDLVLVDPPLGATVSKNDSYLLEKFRLSSKNPRTSDLMIEQAIQIARKGAYVVVLVPESTLSGSGASKEVRELIEEETIIEAIVSLPSHILKPLATVKLNVLVLRKKKSKDEKAEDVFLGKIESVEEIDEVIAAFKVFRKERGLCG